MTVYVSVAGLTVCPTKHKLKAHSIRTQLVFTCVNVIHNDVDLYIQPKIMSGHVGDLSPQQEQGLTQVCIATVYGAYVRLLINTLLH